MEMTSQERVRLVALLIILIIVGIPFAVRGSLFGWGIFLIDIFAVIVIFYGVFLQKSEFS